MCNISSIQSQLPLSTSEIWLPRRPWSWDLEQWWTRGIYVSHKMSASKGCRHTRSSAENDAAQAISSIAHIWEANVTQLLKPWLSDAISYHGVLGIPTATTLCKGLLTGYQLWFTSCGGWWNPRKKVGCWIPAPRAPVAASHLWFESEGEEKKHGT